MGFDLDSINPGVTFPTTLASQGFSCAIKITRPANTTAYTANDVVGNTSPGAVLTFLNMAPPAGGRIMITSASLEVDVAAVPAGMTNFLLYLYAFSPPSFLADNAAHDIAANDRTALLGEPIDLGVPVDRGSTLLVGVNGINKQIALPTANLYGYLVTVGGFTPAGNSEDYVLTLHSVAV